MGQNKTQMEELNDIKKLQNNRDNPDIPLEPDYFSTRGFVLSEALIKLINEYI